VIVHVVIWRIKADAKQAGQIRDIDRIRASVASLRNATPGLLRLQLGINQCVMPDAADLMLFCEFESWQALSRYQENPLHDELRALIGPLREERRVVDCEI
jgi:hypothetical protein